MINSPKKNFCVKCSRHLIANDQNFCNRKGLYDSITGEKIEGNKVLRCRLVNTRCDCPDYQPVPEFCDDCEHHWDNAGGCECSPFEFIGECDNFKTKISGEVNDE
jgi:hypothetical protein